MNSILSIIRCIPGVSHLEKIAGYAFGRIWSILDDDQMKALPVSPQRPAHPYLQFFGTPGQEIWKAPGTYDTQFQLDEEPPVRKFTKTKPIRISRSPEQEEGLKTEHGIERQKSELSQLLKNHTLHPGEYKRAWDLLIDLQIGNEEINSPKTAGQIQALEARLKSFKKTIEEQNE